MSTNTFVRSTLFAAVAAAAWVPWALTAGPMIGVWNARALYLIGTTTLYVAGLSPRSTQRITLGIVVGAIATGVALIVHTTAELCIGLAVLLGVARSAFLYRAKPARAAATEIGLLVGGLLSARFLGGPWLLSTASAIWGFFLVQSFFFLIAGTRQRRPTGAHPDPFEEAYRRADALLERIGP